MLEAYGNRSYRWDAAGDLEEVEDLGTGARLGLEYDALGNLRAATLPDGREVEYLVDVRNRRVGVVVDGVGERAWVYSGQLNPVLELRPDGGRSRFAYGTRSHVPEYMERDGERYRLVTDHLGSVRLVVNVTTGLVAQRLAGEAAGYAVADPAVERLNKTVLDMLRTGLTGVLTQEPELAGNLLCGGRS